MSISTRGNPLPAPADEAAQASNASLAYCLTDALGEPDFAESLLAFIRTHVDIEQIVLLALNESDGFEPIFSAGTIAAPEEAARLVRLYCRKYFQLDPLFERIARYGNNGETGIELCRGAPPHAPLAQPFRRLSKLGDKCSLLFGRSGWTYYLSFYRRKGMPGFSGHECRRLERLAPTLRGLIYAHHGLMQEYEREAWPRSVAAGRGDCRSAGQLLCAVHHLLANGKA